MKYWHKRVEIRYYNELTDEQQASAIFDLNDLAADETYLVVPNEPDQFWYLSEFMRADHGRYHGITHLTNTSGIGLVLDKTQEFGLVQCFG